jgi:hypothetical protein
MATAPTMVANTQTVPNNPNSVVTSPLPSLRTVTFILRITAANFTIPYAVEVGGVVRPGYSQRPKQLRCSSNGTGAPVGGKIVVEQVPPGTVVQLYLNSDAHPDYRKNPVYAVTPNARNVVVEIREKAGHATETDVVVQEIDPNATVETAKTADTYKAKLTGITWMKVTHKYALSEVNALLPAGTTQVVIDAVRSVYSGLTTGQIILVEPGPPERRVTVTIQDSDNAVSNVASGYTFFEEGLKRVHPAAYAAFFTAGIASGATSITINSGWRPMLGSIAHRAGLGIDVSILGATVMNRAGLRTGTTASLNVSAAEKTAFQTYRTTPTAESKAAWNTVRDNNEPAAVKKFRDSLIACTSVKQILDPWFMDLNNLDAVPHEPNDQSDEPEKKHKNHLHVTIHDPKIRG